MRQCESKELEKVRANLLCSYAGWSMLAWSVCYLHDHVISGNLTFSISFEAEEGETPNIGRFNLLRRAGSLGKILPTCSQYEIKYSE